MYRSPQSIAQRDLAYLPAGDKHATNLAVLTEAHTQLMGMGKPLSKFPTFERTKGPTRAVPMLPGRLDFHIQAYLTRTKRAAKDTYSFDRRSSELYPQAAPMVNFVGGNATRLVGRDQIVLLP